MFGIGFTELILISIVAIIFLGPDKLPQALVDMAKFIKSVKKAVSDAKGSLEEEMKIADLKEEALGYKKQLDEATNELQNFKNIDFDDFDDDVTYDEEVSTKSSKELASKPVSTEEKTTVTQVEQKQDENVALKKKPKKTQIAKNESQKKTNNKTTDDTPKDNA